jgi:nucleolar GTP-binding protein
MRYLDHAFSQSKKRGRGELPAVRLDIVKECLTSQLTMVLTAYPSFNSLPPFYAELSTATLDIPQVKAALASISWCIRKIAELTKIYKTRIRRSKSKTTGNKHFSEYYGRISSLLERLDKHFIILDRTRRAMRDWPDIKELFTVAIAGFPNVGKSTLLSKVTPARPNIKAYAFTTTTLNVGYLSYEYHRIQLIDTPGTLARPEKMNAVERQAYLAIKHAAHMVIFVFDPTMEKEKQLLLYHKIRKEFHGPFIIYVSKTDLSSPPELPFPFASSIDEIKELILHSFKKTHFYELGK